MSKVLIIEDEDLIRTSIIELLELEDYDCYGAADGLEGIALIDQVKPDLIICDVMMPKANGYEVLKYLRSKTETENTPFIFLTAKASKGDTRFGMDLGADDYLAKPFNQNDLYNSVKSRFQKQTSINNVFDNKIKTIKSNLAANLPHELRTPLNGILAASQFLLQEFKSMDEGEIEELLKTIYASGNRLNKLVNNYLSFSEIELLSLDKQALKNAKQVIVSNPISLLNDTYDKVSKDYNRSSHSILVHNEILDFPFVHFKKIITEIIENAFKFSERDTTVVVMTHTKDNFYFVEVKNQNKNNTQVTIDKIAAFEQFNRDIYEQQGSGLGLIISKKLLDIFNGTLEISHSNENINFKLGFPILEEIKLTN